MSLEKKHKYSKKLCFVKGDHKVLLNCRNSLGSSRETDILEDLHLNENASEHEHSARKGPFWLVGLQQLIAYPVEVSVSPVPSHKTVWPLVKGQLSARWNFYPRGRVEVRGGKAVVFANSLCLTHPTLGKNLRDAFNLDGIELEFKADNSAHYTEGVYDEGNIRKHENRCKGKSNDKS